MGGLEDGLKGRQLRYSPVQLRNSVQGLRPQSLP